MNWFGIFLFSILRPALGLIILAGLLIFWLLKKKLPPLKSLRKIIIIFIVIIVVQALLMSFLNYYAWKNDALSQKLLPPDTPISYFLHYSWLHYFLNPFLSILVAIVVFYGIQLLNRKFNNVLFYDEERYLAVLGVLITNWPNCLIYLCLVLFLGVISHLFIYFFNVLIHKGVRNVFTRNYPQPSGHWQRKRGDVVEKTVAQAERAGFLSGVLRSKATKDEAKKSEAERERSDLAGVGHSVFSKQLSEPLRLSLLYFWLPCALLVLFLGGIISKYFMV